MGDDLNWKAVDRETERRERLDAAGVMTTTVEPMTAEEISRVAQLFDALKRGGSFEEVICPNKDRLELEAGLIRLLADHARQSARIAELEAEIGRLRELVGGALSTFENCAVASGVCGCGDSMENHPDPMNCGHSPVDYGEYVVSLWCQDARAALSAPNPAGAKTGGDRS